MRTFKHVNAATVEEAVSVLQEYGEAAKVMAGGTDLIGEMKDEILPQYPEILVNLKTIPGLDYIQADGAGLKIGAMTRLEDIARDQSVRQDYTALAEAARRAASPHIREMGTISGNICQNNRCWFYWVQGNRFNCMRKGGRICYAIAQEDRYHSIFGATDVGSTPCSSDCPDHIDIAAYMAKIREGDLPGAAEILLRANPLPAITGRICPHFCEEECNRGGLDEAISIRSVERVLGDYILENAAQFIKAPKAGTKKVAVVGSGPAGLAAAYFLMKAGHNVTVFDRMEEAGGLLTYGIPGYRLPKTVVKKQVEAFEAAGIKFQLKANLGQEITVDGLAKSFDAVFIACGVWKERPAGVKGEAALTSGLQFLVEAHRGAKEMAGKKVAVIGGGNVAVDVARTLLRLGAEPVMIYRRTEAEMPAIKEEIKNVKEEKIKIEFLTSPTEATRQGNQVALTCVRMKLGAPDKSGRPQPIPIEGSDFTMEFDAVMKAIGEGADTACMPAEFFDAAGRLPIDPATAAMAKNVFAGGDFITGATTVVEAMAAGRKAAGSIDQYLGGTKKEEAETVGSLKRFDSHYLKKTDRVQSLERPVEERLNSLDGEDIASIGIAGARAEANRCFNCGCVAVNPSDVAPALVALNAKIKTTQRVIEADDFFAVGKDRTTVLEEDEIVTEIQIPKPSPDTKSIFIKYALRKSIDFPIVNCALVVEVTEGSVKSARICLNSVYNNPYRATKAEELITGKAIDESTAETAGNAAVADSSPALKSRYKVPIAKTLVKRALLACK
jgi:NADPH-dependent glutamate synthase beta subunit-like oxidoreductase/CO/xanthine dehydrogenase FAD-binding subunit